MFRFTQEPSSGSYIQCLANITSLVQPCLSVQTSGLWRHILTVIKGSWCACVWFIVQRSTRILLLQSEYATITMTTSVPTRTVEQDL